MPSSSNKIKLNTNCNKCRDKNAMIGLKKIIKLYKAWLEREFEIYLRCSAHHFSRVNNKGDTLSSFFSIGGKARIFWQRKPCTRSVVNLGKRWRGILKIYLQYFPSL